MRTRTSAHRPGFGVVWVRGPPGPHWGFAPGPGMRTRTSAHRPGFGVVGARTSRSALGFAPRPGCGRGRPRTAPGSGSSGCADLPVRIGLCTRAGNADEDVRAPPRVRRRLVRGPPGPHWASRQGRECGRGRPRTARGSASSGCADLPVRIERCLDIRMTKPRRRGEPFRSPRVPLARRSVADSRTCASFPPGTPSRIRACSSGGRRGCGPRP